MTNVYSFGKVRVKMFNVLVVAQYFLSLVDEASGSVMTHLKLQKLCYYAQAWFLAFYGRPMFRQEFEAWAHGPVCSPLWRIYRECGAMPIRPAEDYDLSSIPQEAKEVLDEIWRVYGDYDAKYLERLTHQELPWIEARGTCQPDERCNTKIKNETMMNFYRSFLKN